ncbi:hypothetical protein DH2020_001628 [Rehmannia glutinosa]|uniref:rRNA-processing protein FYV7 n=1 Tax=Rehmannia glutinosa TaxID=99300 RepID=A0ABR0Y006_REHGL
MTKGGGISNENQGKKMGGQDFIKNKKKMKKNMQRLGGRGGLSLESFANIKARNENYNPSVIKKQREFYKNAKYVKKYKRSFKQDEQLNIPPTDQRPLEEQEKHSKSRELYEKKREEEEKARMEREAMIQAKKEERQKSEARRRALKEKMYKKTKSGQPVMKYRIEHLLETIQGSTT